MDSMPESTAKIVVKVRTGYGIYPLEGALVTVSAENFANGAVLANVYTDETGSTPPVLISLPFEEEKVIPEEYRITVETEKEGYLREVFQGVELYGGVTTVQLVNMSALPDKDGALLMPYDVEMIVSAPAEGTPGKGE